MFVFFLYVKKHSNKHSKTRASGVNFGMKFMIKISFDINFYIINQGSVSHDVKIHSRTKTGKRQNRQHQHKTKWQKSANESITEKKRRGRRKGLRFN